MGFDPLPARILAMLHDALVPQPLCVGAGAAYLLLRLRVRRWSLPGFFFCSWGDGCRRCTVPHLLDERSSGIRRERAAGAGGPGSKIALAF